MENYDTINKKKNLLHMRNAYDEVSIYWELDWTVEVVRIFNTYIFNIYIYIYIYTYMKID